MTKRSQLRNATNTLKHPRDLLHPWLGALRLKVAARMPLIQQPKEICDPGPKARFLIHTQLPKQVTEVF